MFTTAAGIAPKRVAAMIIDLLIGGLIYLVLSWVFWKIVVWALACYYLLIRDAIGIRDLQGASPGKRFLGLKALQGKGGDCDRMASIKRNLGITLGPLITGLLLILLTLIPLVDPIWAFYIGGLVFLLVGAMELEKIFNEEGGQRIGDLLADTYVVETHAYQEAHHDSRVVPHESSFPDSPSNQEWHRSDESPPSPSGDRDAPG